MMCINEEIPTFKITVTCFCIAYVYLLKKRLIKKDRNKNFF